MNSQQQKSERERCARIAESEPVPSPGTMPDELRLVPLEDAIIAAIQATKRNIARRIRSGH